MDGCQAVGRMDVTEKEGLVVRKVLTTVTGGAGDAAAEYAIDFKEKDGLAR